MATAAPDIPAIKAWLSLVGIPKYHAAVAQITIAAMAAHKATRGKARIVAEIYHVVDRKGDRAVNGCHYKNAEKIENCRHNDSLSHLYSSGGNTGGNSVWRIRPAIDQYNSQCQDSGHQQHWIANHLTYKFG